MKYDLDTKSYTVIFLLNRTGTKVLLQLKDRTEYTGKLNGVGRKIEDKENPEQGAYREILEETSIESKDIQNLTWLGTLICPENCDERNRDKFPELWFYGAVIYDEDLAKQPKTESEKINWYTILEDNTIDTNGLELAGDGNIPYFIGLAKRYLFGKG